MVGEEVSLAGHSQKSVRQDAAHSRRDADAPPGIANREGGWSDQGRRKGLGACGGLVAASLGPVFGPSDKIVTGGELDGQRGKALEEMLAGRGCGPTVGWGAWG